MLFNDFSFLQFKGKHIFRQICHVSIKYCLEFACDIFLLIIGTLFLNYMINVFFVFLKFDLNSFYFKIIEYSIQDLVLKCPRNLIFF